MNYFKKLLIISIFILFSSPSIYAFTVQKIEFQGLQRVSNATALRYLPVTLGEDLTIAKTPAVIKALYQTGFFTDIKLLQQGNTLVVVVQEQPTIAEVHVNGNDVIPEDKLNDALKKMGLQQGEIFQHNILKQVEQALADQYYSGGYYNAKVTTKVTTLPRNRVAIDVNVSEGRIAKVEGIKVIGNHVFDESTLVRQFTLSTPSFMTFFNGADKYSKDALDKSIEALKNYYLDNGYIKVQIPSQQVTITPDRKSVYIIVTVIEGEKYNFGNYKLSGNLIFPEQDFTPYISVKSGETFSRQKVLDTNEGISRKLEDAGYAYAKVEAKPDIDEKNRVVSLTFNVTPGSRYYIRRINFEGNNNTTNIALRNYFVQMENSQYSKTNIETSERNLRQLPYIDAQELSYGLEPVEGTNNQIDLNMKVKEAMSAQFQFNIGYSQAEKFMVSTSVTQQNFMGTGRTVGVSLQASAYERTYSLNYTNPFFTPDGVSHSMSAYIQQVNADAVSIANFSTSSYGFNDSYGFPLSNYDSFNLGYGLKDTHLIINGQASTQMAGFEQQYGNVFHQLLLTAGWSHNTSDRYKLPTAGNIQDLNFVVSTPIDHKKLEYYTGTYDNRQYLPLTRSHNWIFTTLATVGYGDGYGSFDQLPFFENYYAGGLGVLGQVRGYEANTLGPLDSLGNTIGGNELIIGSAGLIVPNPGQDHGVRTTLFVDAGNVYNTQQGSPNLNKLRYSTGLQVLWWTPLNIPLVFSIAHPFHTEPGDALDPFQFTLGATL